MNPFVNQSSNRVHLLAFPLALALAGCDGYQEQGDVDSVSQPAYVLTTSAWPMSNGRATIPVCWESSADAYPNEKTWVQTAVEALYENHWAFYVDFTGWGRCTSASKGIRIRNWTGSCQVEALGKAINGMANGMSLNFTTFGAANASCLASEANRRWCIETSAFHEFLHALSFAHEQNRSDTPSSCTSGPQGSNGNLYIGKWDQESIENYCNSWERILSEGDIAGLARLYGGGNDVYVSISNGSSFDVTSDWHPQFCTGNEVCLVGNFDGDAAGRRDVVAFTRGSSADVYVALSNGWSFEGTGWKWHDNFCSGTQTCRVGDVNGDGKDDIIAFTNDANADVYVALSTGSSFGPARKWHDYFCTTGEYCDVGYINNDRKADILAFTRGSTADVFVSLSDGVGSFVGSGGNAKWHDWFCAYNETCRVADVNGDRLDDIIAFTNNSAGDVFVSLSTGSGFNGSGGTAKWHDYFCVAGEQCEVADMNGDGYADLVAFVPGQNGAAFVSLSNGSRFLGSGGNLRWASGVCNTGNTCILGDVTGKDASGKSKADVITFIR
jgi:hypothetical protein